MDTTREYTPDEVTAVVASALRRQRSRDSIPYSELVDIAAQLGIGTDCLDEALSHLSTERDMERARELWLKRQRREFRDHVVSYLIVNAFLFTVNVMTSSYLWFLWAAAGWGMGLAFHAYGVFWPNPEEVEAGARKLLKRAQRQGVVLEGDRIAEGH